MFSAETLLPDSPGKICSSDKGWSFGFSTWYSSYSDIAFWAILSCIYIDCTKVIIVNYVLLSCRLVAAVHIV